jgi:hypothetical protein
LTTLAEGSQPGFLLLGDAPVDVAGLESTAVQDADAPFTGATACTG